MNLFVVTLCVAGELERTVRNNFVCVHVCARASTALNRIDNKRTIEIALGNFATGSHDKFVLFAIEFANLEVGIGCRFFYKCQRTDETSVVSDRNARYRKV